MTAPVQRSTRNFLLTLGFLLTTGLLFAQTTVTGTVREAGSRQALVGVNVYAAALGKGTTTDAAGRFALTVASTDSVTLSFSFVGYTSVAQRISPKTTAPLAVELVAGSQLTEVVVRGGTSAETAKTSLDRIAVSTAQLARIPALLGEKDVLKVIQLLPGVQKGTEGTAGVYVRGGGPDQNLILLDDAPIYNASHLFGFFSVFNGDVLRGVNLTKGGFPAQYGGRLSSVIDLTTKNGNADRLKAQGSVGLIASRLTLDGPLGKNASFVVAGRYSYYGLLTQQLSKNSAQGTPTQANFYDLNAKLNVDLGPDDQLSLSAYTGSDVFNGTRSASGADLRAGLTWGNTAASLRWNHTMSENTSVATALVYSGYQLRVTNQDAAANQVYQLEYASSIRDLSLKTDWTVAASARHTLRLGLQSTYHRFTPSAVVSAGTSQMADNAQTLNALESGAYAEDEFTPTNRLRLTGGLRLSHYAQGTTQYLRPEPRASLTYSLPADWSVKASYARMNQYVHLLSNTGVGLPTDLWVPTTDRVKPQQSQQVALGLAKEINQQKGLALTVEGYYKTMSNLISYREGASFLLPATAEGTTKTRWEDDVTSGRGFSYGVEVLLQKRVGRFTGWMGYTLSRTQWQFAELNNGQPFFPRYDRRHDVSLVGTYDLSPHVRLSGTWVYGTGQALTVPVARYAATTANGTTKTVRDYSEKNSFRAEPYHRLDLSLQFVKQKSGGRERIWEVSVYNAYNRRNPFFYAMEGKTDAATNTSRTVLYRYSLFAVIPTLSYSFKL
jgi:outer membrane receptor for ferrienterochelin and colicin